MSDNRAPDAPLTPEELAQAATAAPAHAVVCPAPEPIVWPAAHADGKPFKLKLPPPKQWLYRRPNGDLYGAVARWDRTGGKIVLPCVYAAIGAAEPSWQWLGFGPNRPPLYAEQLSAQPTAPVLIVMGEKTADAARKYLPDGWLVTTFQGGDNAVHYTDWSALDGHQAVIWPDLDPDRTDKAGKPIVPSGEQCALTLQRILHNRGIACDTVPVYGPKFAKAGFPRNGWDLADSLPPNIAGDAITSWLMRTLKTAYLPEPEAPVPTIAPSNVVALPVAQAQRSERPAPGHDSDLQFQVLGYQIEPLRFYFLGRESQGIHEFTISKIIKKDAMLEMVPDTLYWARQYGSDGNGTPWSCIGEGLARACYQKGIYNPETRRGRGAWIEGGNRVVFHAGEKLFVDGVPVNLGQINSRYVYTIAPSFFDDIQTVAPLTAGEGKQLIAICRMMPWAGRNRLFGDLSAGLIASAVICGALRWRSHGWWTGFSGSGKSWFMENVVGRCLEGLAITPVGDTTEAGIRRTLGGDSRPVVFDEFEAKGINGQTRREAVINLMRSSASEGRGVVIKADAGSGAASFRIRSTFLLASIDVGLKEAADETRCIVLTLANQQGFTPAEKQAAEQRFADIQAAAASLPADLSAKLLARLLPLLPVIRQNIETLSTLLGAKLSTSGTKRIGDLYGTPIGCLLALQFEHALSQDEATAIVDRYDWSPFLGRNDLKEDREILTHLLTKTVRTPLKRSGTTQDRPIGELMAVASSPFDDNRDLDPDDCRRILIDHGFRYQEPSQTYGPESGFLIACRHPKINEILSNTGYATGYARTLARNIRAVETGKNSVRFRSVKTTAIFLPMTVLIGSPDDGTE